MPLPPRLALTNERALQGNKANDNCHLNALTTRGRWSTVEILAFWPQLNKGSLIILRDGFQVCGHMHMGMPPDVAIAYSLHPWVPQLSMLSESLVSCTASASKAGHVSLQRKCRVL